MRALPIPTLIHQQLLASTHQLQFCIKRTRWKCMYSSAVCSYAENGRKKAVGGLQNEAEARDNEAIVWWQEKMRLCKKPVTLEMIKMLSPTNVLGLDPSLRYGSLKDGTLNAEVLEFKRRFPQEVVLCRVGDFYEACGYDACILVEYAGLNPMGGVRPSYAPRAGCPVANLRQTIEDVISSGLSVCVVEEVQGMSQTKCRRDRFIAGHAHPGSPYVYGLVEAETDIDFPEPCAVVGISHSSRGYCLVSVVEMMRTYAVEDGLTEEALMTKLRAMQYQWLYLHRSLRSSSGGVFLGTEFKGNHVEWFEHEPVPYLLEKVKEIYDVNDEFREIVRPSAKRPRPIFMGTACQIGVLPLPGIPSLLKALVPADCSSVCIKYLRDLLLNPPPYTTAASIQDAIKLMGSLKCSVPAFLCIPAGKLVKLIGAREVSSFEFMRIKNLAEDVLYMYHDDELRGVFDLLLDPVGLATGLKIDAERLVSDCVELQTKISSVVSHSGDPDQVITKSAHIPDDFFVDMESGWKARVQRKHAEAFYAEVEKSAEELIAAVEADFVPIVMRTKSLVQSSFCRGRGEICYSREHQSIWFKGRAFKPLISGGDTLGEEEIERLKPAQDSRSKKVGDECHTTERVDKAIARYRDAVSKANLAVVQTLRNLADGLKSYLNSIVFISSFCIIAKALFAHASEGKRRGWSFPTLVSPKEPLVLQDLLPYWLDTTQDYAVPNSFEMNSMCLLTGPNGGGKSSLLRSVCAAALLGTCGLMIPSKRALIPQLDSIMLRMMTSDSPAEGKSLFQVEMTELKGILMEATQGSLILVDELCKGTDVEKGTCLLASVLEKLDRLGCYGFISTHLHGLLDMELNVRNVVRKSMGTRLVNDQLEPTWELVDGECRESLAFETAKREGVGDDILERAREIYNASRRREAGQAQVLQINRSKENGSITGTSSTRKPARSKSMQDARSLEDVKEVFLGICNGNKCSGVCYLVGPRQQPPPFTTNQSCVYILQRPDGKFYIGQTDNLAGRIAAHRASPGLKQAPFLYLPVSNKSVACQLETTLISQLSQMGLGLVNKVDQKHKHFGINPVEAPF